MQSYLSHIDVTVNNHNQTLVLCHPSGQEHEAVYVYYITQDEAQTTSWSAQGDARYRRTGAQSYS